MTLDELKREAFKNPEIKKEYDALEPEFQVIQAMIEGRRNQQLTQAQLAAITGIDRTDISRLENGNANPSLKTLKRLADGLGMKTNIQFVTK